MFFLDTNVIIAVMNRRDAALDARLQYEIVGGSTLIVPVPVLSELRYGADKSAVPARNHAALDGFLAPIPVADFDSIAADRYGKVRADLERRGTPIGDA